MDELTRTPHDALFRGVFGDRANALDVLMAVLPPEVAGRLEAGSIEPLAETFVDGRLRTTIGGSRGGCRAHH